MNRGMTGYCHFAVLLSRHTAAASAGRESCGASGIERRRGSPAACGGSRVMGDSSGSWAELRRATGFGARFGGSQGPGRKGRRATTARV
jgi:hypothetical protein